MGAGQSSSAGAGLTDLEIKLRGSGDLGSLERAFHCLTQSPSPSEAIDKKALLPITCLQDCFQLAPLSVKEGIHEVMANIGQAIVSEFYESNDEKINWIQFLEGYQKCSADTGMEHLKHLFSVFYRASRLAEQGSKQETKSVKKNEEKNVDVGFLTGAQFKDFLHICWLFMCHARLPAEGVAVAELEVSLPKADFLLSAAFSACKLKSKGEMSQGQSMLEAVLSASELSSWVLATIPSLTECLVRFVRAQLSRFPAFSKANVAEENASNQIARKGESGTCPQDGEEKSLSKKDGLLLHSGTAWAVGLSLRDHAAAEILFRASCGIIESPNSELPTLLYRSSVHGSGLNRFWTCVDGYHAPVLVLISAHTQEESSTGTALVIGALIVRGFENKTVAYGASGSFLYTVEPVFCPFRASGKEKYYVYSHKHTAGAVYSAQKSVEGIGFGGSYGKERVWLNEDFATLTVRHHAVDKTYQPGALVPGQGFSQITAKVLEVEIWGLGGDKAEEEQAKFLKRENLFSEQRRKVDLASFGNWENSPEKMMMDMILDIEEILQRYETCFKLCLRFKLHGATWTFVQFLPLSKRI
ncbi:hypothetical protein R1flu_019409 [Riccia fluitans]|uniref:TLDc domain-containing protein n=1 Tax=Riccia fluitans TaxID=41844 RepID=A0ABD1ZK50_9MARC